MNLEKKIIDEVSGWLKVFEDGTVDRTWTGPPAVKFLTEPVAPHEKFIDGVATRDIIIDKKRNARVRIYFPKTYNQEKLPIILHFHGGGFCISQADWYMYYHMYSRLAQEARAIVVSVYLRLAPENRLPDACEDGFSALLWLQELAQSHTGTDDAWFRNMAQVQGERDADAVWLQGPAQGQTESQEDVVWLRELARGQAKSDASSAWLKELAEPDADAAWLSVYGDFDRVFLIGDSSGGNLVHEVAARAGGTNLSPVRLRGMIPIHPGFVRSKRSKSELEQQESPLLTLEMVDKFLNMALPVGATKDHPITCPMGDQAPPIFSLKLPRVLLCIAENDLIYDTEMEYYEELKKANKKVELFISNGMGHSFYLNKIAVDMDPKTDEETEKLIAGIADFVNKA